MYSTGRNHWLRLRKAKDGWKIEDKDVGPPIFPEDLDLKRKGWYHHNSITLKRGYYGIVVA